MYHASRSQENGDTDGVSTIDDSVVRLTRFSHGAGCACKLAPGDLAAVMKMVTPATYPPEVVVSPATGDDAGVYRLPSRRAAGADR